MKGLVNLPCYKGEQMKKIILISLLIVSCGGAAGDPTYDDIILEGWTNFEAAEYATAIESFDNAVTTDPTKSEAYSGRGWSQMKLDNLSFAETSFSDGAAIADAGADLFAGYAFLLNAQKLYANSNTRASQALTLDATWTFAHISSVSAADLHVVIAENHFALGNFAASLAEVKILNSSFNANVATAGGQSLLGAEIERLKSISKLK